MASITKTVNQTLLALQSIATAVVVVGTPVDVSTKLAGLVLVHWGRQSATALTKGITIRIEASAKSSGDGFWFPIAEWTSLIAAVNTEAVSGTVSAGQNVITVASTTGYNVGDVVYIDNGTIANSEWGRIKVVTSNTSITIEDNLVNAQTGANLYPSGATVYPTNEGIVCAMIDLTSIARIRMVAGGQTAQAVAVEGFLVTGDSIG